MQRNKQGLVIVVGIIVCMVVVLVQVVQHNGSTAAAQQYEHDREQWMEQQRLLAVRLQAQEEALAHMQQELLQTNERAQRTVSAYQEEIEMDLAEMRQLLVRLPDVQKRLAYVLDYAADDHTIIVDPAEWLVKEEGKQAAIEDGELIEDPDGINGLPNGFYLRNKKKEEIKQQLAKDVLVFTLKGSSRSYLDQELGAYVAARPNGLNLFWLYEIDQQVVLMQEQYVP